MGFIRATATATFRSDAGRFIAGKITPAVRAGVEAFGNLVLEESQALVPVDTGELKASGSVVVVETDKTVRAEVVYSAGHAAFVEYGTGIRGASSPGAGKGPYSPTWPGMVAQPFLRPALDSAREAGRALFNAQIAAAMRV